jgi:uncharacterized membrane protein YfcA
MTPALFAAVALLALGCEYMDASIGMGYGTTLTPILLIVGFAPLEVVHAVLLGQLVGGVFGGLTHHRVGNISLDFRRDAQSTSGRLRRLVYLPRSVDSKVITILAVCGVAGALVGVFTAINIPKVVLQTYIGAMVLVIGVIIFVRRNHGGALSWRRLVGIGLLSSFNKGISGGGYGPLVTGGQVISGRETKSSVGSTTVAEVFVCIVGFLAYALAGRSIFWRLAAAATIGSAIAAPLAALTVRKVGSQRLKLVIGLATILLGAFTLVRTFIL